MTETTYAYVSRRSFLKKKDSENNYNFQKFQNQRSNYKPDVNNFSRLQNNLRFSLFYDFTNVILSLWRCRGILFSLRNFPEFNFLYIFHISTFCDLSGFLSVGKYLKLSKKRVRKINFLISKLRGGKIITEIYLSSKYLRMHACIGV